MNGRNKDIIPLELSTDFSIQLDGNTDIYVRHVRLGNFMGYVLFKSNLQTQLE
jgi:hypothetical protein